MSQYGPPPGDPNQPNPNQPGQYGGQQGYSNQPGHHDGPKPGKGLAIAALVLGVIALLTFWTVFGGIIFGLIAIILGFVASGKAKRGTASGRGLAIAGIVTGALGLIIGGALFALGAAFLSSDTAQNLQSCLEDAGDDQAAVDQCSRDFEGDLSN